MPSFTSVSLLSTDMDGFTIGYTAVEAVIMLFPVSVDLTIPSSTFVNQGASSKITCFANLPGQTDKVLTSTITALTGSTALTVTLTSEDMTGVIRCSLPSRDGVPAFETLTKFSFIGAGIQDYGTPALYATVLALAPVGIVPVGNIKSISARVEVGKSGDRYPAYLIVAAESNPDVFTETQSLLFGSSAHTRLITPAGSQLASLVSSCFYAPVVPNILQGWFFNSYGSSVSVLGDELRITKNPTRPMYCSAVYFACALSAVPTQAISDKVHLLVQYVQGTKYAYGFSKDGGSTGIPIAFDPANPTVRPDGDGVVVFIEWHPTSPVTAIGAQDCPRITYQTPTTPFLSSVDFNANHGALQSVKCINEAATLDTIIYTLSLPPQVAFIGTAFAANAFYTSGLGTALSDGVWFVTGLRSMMDTSDSRLIPADRIGWRCQHAPTVFLECPSSDSTCTPIVCASDEQQFDGLCDDAQKPITGCANLKFAAPPTLTFEGEGSSSMCKVSFEVAANSAVATEAPDVTFTLKSSIPNLFNWTPSPCANCVYDSTNQVLQFTASGISQSGSVSIPCAPARYTSGTETLTVNAVVLSTPATLIPGFASGISVTVPEMGALLAPQCTASVSFAPNAAGGTVGSLYAFVDCGPQYGLGTTTDTIDAVFITLPAGWSFTGATCSFSESTLSNIGTGWYPRYAPRLAELKGDGSGFDITSTGYSIGQLTSALLACDSVTANPVEGTVTRFVIKAGLHYFSLPVSESLTADVVNGAFASSPTFVAYYLTSKVAGEPVRGSSLISKLNEKSDMMPSLIPVYDAKFYGGIELGHGQLDLLVIKLTGKYRALYKVLSSSVVESGIALIATVNTDMQVSLPVGSEYGVWKCDNDDTGVFSDCVVSGNPLCSNTFHLKTCVSAANTAIETDIKNVACMDAADPPAVSSGCQPKLTVVVDATTSDDSISVLVNIGDPGQFIGKPTVKLTFAPPRAGLLPWTSNPLCTSSASLTCTIDATDNESLVIEVASVSADFSLSIASVWDEYVGYGDFLTVTAKANDANAFAVGTSMKFPTGLKRVITLDGPTSTASFAGNGPNSPIGTLALEVAAGNAAGGVLSPTPFNTDRVSIKLPEGWKIHGSSCDIVFNPDIAAWLPNLTFVSASVDAATGTLSFSEQRLQLTKRVYIICDNVEAATVTHATVDVGFGSVDKTGIAVAASGTTKMSFDMTNAPMAPRYVTYTLSQTGSVDDDYLDSPALKALVLGSARFAAFSFNARHSSGTLYLFTIEYTAGNRALEFIFASNAAKSGLLAVTGFLPAPGSPTSGFVGVYKCRDGSSNTFVVCAMTPVGCSKEFQGEIVCLVDATVTTDACNGSKAPEPSPDTALCMPSITSFSVSYASSTLIVTFAKNAKTFIGTPAVTFTIVPSVSHLFDWSNVGCQAGATCTPEADGSITVVLASVDEADAFGNITLTSPAKKYAAATTKLKFTAVTDKGINALAGVAATDIPIGIDVGVIPLGAGTEVTAAFQPKDATKTIGTLLLSAYSAGAASATPLIPSGTVNEDLARAGTYSFFFQLPAGWSVGSACKVSIRTSSTSSVWPFGNPLTASPASAPDVSGEIHVYFSDQVLGSSLYGLQVQCDDARSPVTATEFQVPLGFRGAGSSFVARLLPNYRPSLSYNPALAHVGPELLHVFFNYKASVPTIDADDLAVKMRNGAPGAIQTKVAIDTSQRTLILSTRFAAGDGAFKTAMSRMDALMSFLLSAVPNTVADDFTYNIFNRIYEGQWQCEESSVFKPCVITPSMCGDKFQTKPTCNVNGVSAPFGCTFVTPLSPIAVKSGCLPQIDTASISFDAVKAQISLAYTLLDAAQFFSKPDLTFVITQSAAAPFRWTDPMALDSACGAFGTCTASNGGKTLSVKLNQVSAPGSFVVPATAAVYDRAPFLKVNVLNGVMSVFADFDTPTMLSPINYFETVGADKLQHSAAFADATHGSVITSIHAAAGTTVISAVPFLLKNVEVWSQGGSLYSDTCSLRARKPTDSLWPLGKESVVLPSLGPGAFSLATALDLSTISTLYLECSGVDLTISTTAATVNLLSVDDHQLLHIESTSITAAGYTMSVGDAARYIYLEPNFEPVLGDSSGNAAHLRNLVFSNTQNVDLTTLSDQEGTARIVLGFSGASRAWVIPLYTRAVLTSLAADVMTDADVAFSLLPGGVIDSAEQGTWLCDNGSSKDTCAAPNNCGAFTGAMDCYVSPTDAAVNQRACAFVAAPTTPVSTGCGAWQCKDVTGTFVACNDAAVCENGCLQSTPIAVDLSIAQQHLEPNFKSGRFQQFCVLDGVAKVAADFCPSSLVTLSPYAATCNATTTCGLRCAGADGKAKSCDSDLSWGACGVSCGASTQDRLTYCAGSTLAIGSSIAGSAAVHADLCIGKTPAMSMSRSCFGAGCEQYVWKCLDPAGLAIDCTDAAYKSCSVSCGTGTQSRDVVCATVSDTIVTSTAAPEAMCAARAAKPAASKACAATACSSAEWKCYAVGSNPFVASDCASDETFKCVASGCRARVSARRNVACYDGAARAASSKCNAGSKPAATVDCAAVHDGCHVDFTGATCSVAGVGAVTGSCVTSAGDSSNVFRHGVCRDDKGVDVTGACSTAETDEMCVFPVCGASITYAWSTDSTAACVHGCKSYKPVTPLCMATTGSDAAVSVDVSFCASAPNKPLPYTTCPDTACLNAGVCTAAPVTFGTTSVTGIYATCVCPVGFGGDNCERSSDIDSVNIDPSSSTVHWAFKDGDATVSTFVSISISTAATPPPPPPFVAPAAGEAMHALGEGASSEQTLVAIVPSDVGYDGCTGFSSYAIDLSGYAPGSYEVSVQGVSSANSSAVFTAQPACDDGAGCQNGGTCNASTGKCDCVGDYSGERCQLPPCATLACNALTSSCDFLTETTAQCVCKTGFSGVRCETFDGTCDLDTTEGLCASGSVRGVLVKEGTATCGACQCSGNWAGALCNTCTLACQNGGSLAAGSCDKCSCPAGFHGDACELRHATLTLNFRPAAADTDTEAKLAVWIKRLALSLAALSGDSSVPVAVASTKTVTNPLTGATYLQVKTTVGSYAPASSEMFNTYATLAAVKEAHFGGDSASAASRGVNSLPAFSTLSLARGVGFGDEHCANDEDTVCPSNSLNGASMPASPDEDAGSSSGLSRDDKIALGVCLGVGGAIIIAIILFCAFRQPSVPTKATEGVEMSVATYDV